MGQSAWPTSAVRRIKTGTYTGDGTTGQAITGIGFQPKYVKIWVRLVSEAEQYIFEKMDDSWGDYCIYESIVAGSEHRSLDNRINSLDADGFTVDDDAGDAHPNANGRVYSYLALG